MARQPEGDDIDDVDSKHVAGPSVARRERFGGGGHPAQAPFVEGEVGGVWSRPRLDLDEGQGSAAAGEAEIDAALREAMASGSPSRAAADVAKALGLPRRLVYERAQKLK